MDENGKPKRGRPFTKGGQMRKVNFRLPGDELEELEEVATEIGVKPSEYIRSAVREQMRRHRRRAAARRQAQAAVG